ncbi:MAG: hypothetical protein HYZ84_02435 [Candidatus Omnitrophica bacterium]|nr:hypothetical protein [Candidatus Omnitrophota bacterium]
MIEQIETFLAKLSKGERALAFIAIALIVAALMDGMLLGPILNHIKTMEAEIVTKSQTVKRNLRILSFREGILKEYALYMKYLDSGEKKQEEIVAALLRKIETIAAEKSVSVSNIQPGDMSSTSMVQEYKTTLSGEGSLGNVLSFMHALEESDYLFQITKYSLTPKSKGADVMKFTFDISRVLIATENIEGVIPSEDEVTEQPIVPKTPPGGNKAKPELEAESDMAGAEIQSAGSEAPAAASSAPGEEEGIAAGGFGLEEPPAGKEPA